MAQYIKKSDIVAVLESLRCTTFTNFDEGVNCAVQTLLEMLDTLEVKEVDVDLDEEFDRYCDNLYLIDLENEPYAELFECAKHFFFFFLQQSKKDNNTEE